MTIEDFIETRPQNYGKGNINLLLSSSVVNPGIDDTPVPPFTLQGIAIPNISKEGVDISSALREIETLRFDFTEGQVTTTIIGKQKKKEYFYYLIDPINVNTYPSSIGPGGETEYKDSEVVFVPYVQTSFNNNDYNPLINNSEGSKRNDTTQRVDRTTSQNKPTNLLAILQGTAEPAEIQNCSYTKVGIIRGRYNGTKTTAAPTQTEFNKQRFTDLVVSRGIDGNEPALSFTTFKGSIHPVDAKTTTVQALADRKVVDVYFKAETALSGSSITYINFPQANSFIYTVDGNNFKRVVNSKVFAVENEDTFVLNEDGQVIRIE